MIIGYYQQIFFGGGTYYKLSNKDGEEKYKIEYSHSAVPNYIPKAKQYIKKYETLRIEEERKKEYFKGKIKAEYISEDSEIYILLDYITKCDWENISKKEYNDDMLDGVNWYFYIAFDNKQYEIHGYEKFPEKITKIIETLENISNKYINKNF